MNAYDIVIKFVTEVAKVAEVSDTVTDAIMAHIRTYLAQHPLLTSTELLQIMITVERIIRDNTKAFVSFEMFPNVFTAIVIFNHGQENEEQINIICPMEGEIQVVRFKTN